MPYLTAIIDAATAATMVAVVAPLVAVPLTVVTFHLRALREQQTSRQDELSRRLEALERSLGTTRQALVEIQRDYTTKEEWLRESMAARHHLERLLSVVTRLETEIDVVRGWSLYIESRLRAPRVSEESGAPETQNPASQAQTQSNQAEQC
ncbi:MAG: hypothetical protein KAV82_05655 [Phycisphaerae bacterium]|nr:hypothetical protein [Phycisphaerae bacterium]